MQLVILCLLVPCFPNTLLSLVTIMINLFCTQLLNQFKQVVLVNQDMMSIDVRQS